jgi:hypothetical protein
VSTLYDVRTTTKSPNDAFLRTYPLSLSDAYLYTVWAERGILSVGARYGTGKKQELQLYFN